MRYALEDNDEEKAKAFIESTAPKDEKEAKKLEQGVRASLLHPWTGSETRDAAFFQSLDPKDQHQVLKAQFLREAMYGRFQQLLEAYADKHNIDYEARERVVKADKDPYADQRP